MMTLRGSTIALILLPSLATPAEALQVQEPAQQTRVDVRRPVFGGACMLCPWGALGTVVKQAMEPYGYDVQMCYNCNALPSPLIVADARVPPPYRPDPVVPEVLAPRNAPGLGPVDFGATAVQFMVSAYRGEGAYADEAPRTNLRLIANIQSPNYLVVAATKESGITDLSRIREQRWPVKILSRGAGGGPESEVLAFFGLTADEIEAAGGRIGGRGDADDFDLIIHSSQGLTTAPEFDAWTMATRNFELNYVELPEELLARLAELEWYDRGTIPVGLLPGIERPIPTVVRTGTVVYTRSDVPDDFAYDVARAMDEQQHLLQWSQLFFSYNVHSVWRAYEVPLHPGAERYYRDVGYLP
jgi:TRAP transporter TAXI family solute receptor